MSCGYFEICKNLSWGVLSFESLKVTQPCCNWSHCLQCYKLHLRHGSEKSEPSECESKRKHVLRSNSILQKISNFRAKFSANWFRILPHFKNIRPYLPQMSDNRPWTETNTKTWHRNYPSQRNESVEYFLLRSKKRVDVWMANGELRMKNNGQWWRVKSNAKSPTRRYVYR